MSRPSVSSSLCGLAALTLALSACKSGSGVGGSDDPALAAIQARIPPLPAADLGAAPGFLAGGLVYIGLRPGKAQRWLQALPLGPDVVRDLARAGNELGFDPRVDDVAARLGLDPDAVITATLMRPLGDAAGVRALLQRGTNLPPDPFPGITPSDVGPGPRDYDRMIPPPITPPQIEPLPSPIFQQPPPPPPPLITKPTADQGELARRAGALGTHSRVHVPVKDLGLMLAPLRRLAGKNRSPETDSLCGQLGPSELCTGGSRELLLIRAADGAVAIDFFTFEAGTGAAFDPERLAVVQQALSAPIASLAPLSTLRGDFVVYADADAVPAIHEVMSVAEAVGRQRWYTEGVQSSLAEAAALSSLRETRRLFSGARLEVVVDGDTLQATFQWEPRDDAARETLTRLLTRSPAAASVPTISGLCDGSLACLRTAGFPALSGFDELAAGLYAKPERELMDTINRADEWGALVLFLETWPNFFGAAQRWPKQQGGRMETVMLGQALEAVGRIEGLGGSLRSLHIQRGNPSGDFIGYMRLQGQDLALLRSLMGLGGVRFSPVTLPQITGKVEQAQIPDAEVPASLYLMTDPGTVRAGDRDIEAGWAMVADSNDRLSWMLGLERSAAVLPAFYLELPDLWQLFATIDDAQRELNFAQGWLTGRSARLAADIVDGRLRLEFQLARSTPKPAP
ncbi:MAG: hypothetical protein IPO88_12600 [Nannocystis sp.]|uniref:hypothetical protein n=1 Tax=Nannocystis sp. TaxID=1962667 RepID=UPI0024247507|nr:hypothetical protein [Nannocystis sp.]MBK9754324.1 hypothetical protein [Nannocystis sp.]